MESLGPSRDRSTHLGRLPPTWAIKRPKSATQHAIDFLGAPLRMVLLPDHTCERLGLTSLRGERLAAVLPHVHGRLLDVGAGDNVLVQLHKRTGGPATDGSVGVDVVDWGGGCTLIEDAGHLPFPDSSFDTVSFVACLNHIPERAEALREAYRVLHPGGRILVTMIGRILGDIGHRLWWYSEDKHREVDAHEEMGLNREEVIDLLRTAGFTDVHVEGFVYNLNSLYVATR